MMVVSQDFDELNRQVDVTKDIASSIRGGNADHGRGDL
jgi:hypothetical protein